MSANVRPPTGAALRGGVPAGVLGWLLAATPAGAQAWFQGIGDLGGGAFDSGATAVSPDGLIVVGHGTDATGRQAVAWINGVLTPLPQPPEGPGDMVALAVSGDEPVIAGSWTSGPETRAFRWTVAEGTMLLPTLGGLPALAVGAGVSAGSGEVIVGRSRSPAGVQAFRWSAQGGMIGLGFHPSGGTFSEALGVSGGGARIVGRADSASNGVFAFLWRGSGLEPLQPAGLTDGSMAAAISADGLAVVGRARGTGGAEIAVRWSLRGGQAFAEAIGDLPGGADASQALAVNADGSVVAGWGTTAAGQVAFLVDELHGMTSLADLLACYGIDLGGWRLTEARGLSADGRTIVGTGINPAGNPEGWIVRLPAPWPPNPPPAVVLRVKGDGPICGDGLSWPTAFRTLGAALAAGRPVAQAGGSVEIWVAAGRYTPAPPGGSVRASFQLFNRLSVLGGFNGTETSSDQRDPAVNVCVLSGDLNGDDLSGLRADNSLHVLRGENLDDSCVLDGLVIADGHAVPGHDAEGVRGGGLWLLNSSPTIRGCTFRTNRARSFLGRGAAIYARGGSLSVSDTLFLENGGDPLGTVYVEGGTLTATRCDFVDNRFTGAGGGAGIVAGPGAAVVLDSCLFANGFGADGAGAVSGGGGPLTATDCLFLDCGGGIGAVEASGDMRLTDCVFMGNAGSFGVVVGDGEFTRCAFIGNDGGTFGDGAITGDGEAVGCRFLDNVGRLSGAVRGDLRLVECSLVGNRGNSVGAWDGTGTAIGCLFAGNRGGAGIVRGSVSMTNCALVANTATWPDAAAVMLTGGAASLLNCTVAANQGGGIACAGGTLTLWNSIAWGNVRDGVPDLAAQVMAAAGGAVTAGYSCIQAYDGTFGTSGNIGADPRFAGLAGPDQQPGTGDDSVRLRHGSPCIDTGDTAAVAAAVDLYGNPRILDDPLSPLPGGGGPPIVDMGAAEYAPPEVCPVDWDANQAVTPSDIAAFVRDWHVSLTQQTLAGDFDGNGLIEAADVAEFVATWFAAVEQGC